MATFFSGTDTATLKEEGRDRAHFVSLIVNNAGIYTAKITRRVVELLEGTLHQSYPTWGGETKKLTSSTVKEVSEFLEAYPMDITIIEDKSLENSVAARYAAIMEEKKKKTPSTPNGGGSKLGFQGYQGYKETKEKEKGKDQGESKGTEPNLFSAIEEKIACKKEFLQEAVYQLVTGSVASTGKGQNAPSAKDWVEKSMEAIFDRRFGQDINKFKVWMQPYIEFIVYENDPTCFDFDVDGYTDDVLASIVAQDLLTILKTFKTNKYLENIIVELETYVYIIEDDDDDNGTLANFVREDAPTGE